MMRLKSIAMIAMVTCLSCFGRDMAINNGKLTSALNANGFAITNVPIPVAQGDAANKGYVDSISGMTPQAVTNIAGAVVTNCVPSWARAANPPATGVTDVKVDGTSVVTGGVANVSLSGKQNALSITTRHDGWVADISRVEHGSYRVISAGEPVFKNGGGQEWSTDRGWFSTLTYFSDDEQIVKTREYGGQGSNMYVYKNGTWDRYGHSQNDNYIRYSWGGRWIYFRRNYEDVLSVSSEVDMTPSSSSTNRLVTSKGVSDAIVSATNATYVAATNSAAADAEAKYQPKGAYATNASISNDFPIVTNAYTAAEADGKFLSQASPLTNAYSIGWADDGGDAWLDANVPLKCKRIEADEFMRPNNSEQSILWQGGDEDPYLYFHTQAVFGGGYGLTLGEGCTATFNGDVNLNGTNIYDHIDVRVTSATNAVASTIAPIATNAAEAVFAEHADYALTNLTGAAVTLRSGEIGNLSLTSAQTSLALDLNFSAAADRSGDAMLYLVNAADTELAVGPSASVTPIGYKASDKLKAGTNLVCVTRLAYSGGKSVVNVAIKEVK